MTAGACTTPGCGSLGAYLDTSTVRTAGWVQVQVNGQQQGVRWYCTQSCAANALDAGTAADGGAELERQVRLRVVAEIEAARQWSLALYPDDPVMRSRRHGLELARRVVQPGQPSEDLAVCQVCGCTSDDACEGSCSWVPNVLLLDLCSNCAPAESS